MKKILLLLTVGLSWNCGAAITTNKLLSAQSVTNYVNSKFTNSAIFSLDLSVTNGNVYVSGLVNSTNGLLLMARDNIPTNLIPASTLSNTNFLLFNWTNTGVVLIATNINAPGSFLIKKPTLTTSTWP